MISLCPPTSSSSPNLLTSHQDESACFQARQRKAASAANKKKSVSENEFAVHVEAVDGEIFSPRQLVCPQIQPLVKDGKWCFLHYLHHVPHHHLRGHRSFQNIGGQQIFLWPEIRYLGRFLRLIFSRNIWVKFFSGAAKSVLQGIFSGIISLQNFTRAIFPKTLLLEKYFEPKYFLGSRFFANKYLGLGQAKLGCRG